MNVVSFRLTNHLHLSNHRTAFSAVETNNHKCRHLHQGHPAAKLAPFKLGNLSKHVPVPETLRQFQHWHDEDQDDDDDGDNIEDDDNDNEENHDDDDIDDEDEDGDEDDDDIIGWWW